MTDTLAHNNVQAFEDLMDYLEDQEPKIYEPALKIYKDKSLFDCFLFLAREYKVKPPLSTDLIVVAANRILITAKARHERSVN